jgi:hypothetical protein
MCGLSGYSNISDPETRLILTAALGHAIVTRGMGGSGYVNLDGNGGMGFRRDIRSWRAVERDFMDAASSMESCMMHSRGPISSVETDVHPFPIERNGATVLWGSHNGMFDDAWFSARHNGRAITVDSQEVFHLMADNQLAELAKMSGWGVITWVEASNLNEIKICRLTGDSEIFGATMKEGGVVYASTPSILKFACEHANLTPEEYLPMEEVGAIYTVANGAINCTSQPGPRLMNAW